MADTNAPAISLLTRCRAGDPAACAAVRKITARATAGDPIAKRAARLLAQFCTVNGAAVGAWEGSRFMYDQLRPHSPIRPAADTFSAREAYRRGIAALAMSRDVPLPNPYR